MAKHAYLSASASHRWLSCPPSAKLCAEIRDEASPYAQQGTDAHELCEYKVLSALGKDVKDPTEHLDFFDTEMEDCTDEYCFYVMEQYAKAKQFCKVKATCRKRAEYNMELAAYDFELPAKLEESEIAAILPKIDNLVS